MPPDSTVLRALVVLVPPTFLGLVWLAASSRLKRQGRRWPYLAMFCLFGVYLYGVLELTLLSYQSLLVLKLWVPGLQLNGVSAERALNLVPFFGLGAEDIKTSLLNVLLFVPFGLGVRFLTPWSGRRVILVGALVSLSIETLQYATGVWAGQTFRFADVNDLVFNTLGAVLGSLVYSGWRAWRARRPSTPFSP